MTNSRFLLEFLLTSSITMCCLAAVLANFPHLEAQVRLTEPLHLFRSAALEVATDYAFTGRYGDVSDLTSEEDATDHYGNIALTSFQKAPLGGMAMIFNLYTLDASPGYRVHSWHCGSGRAPAPFTATPQPNPQPDFYVARICP